MYRLFSYNKVNIKIFIVILVLLLIEWIIEPNYLLNAQVKILPDNNCITWTQVGSGGGGAMTAIAIDPYNENIVYIGTDLGGIFKTVDGGKTFSCINRGLRELVIQKIVIDPKNPETIYIGTTGGLYKSTNGGDHWERKRSGFPNITSGSFSCPIKALAIDPNKANIIYAGVSASLGNAFFSPNLAKMYNKGQIYKSLDSGETWKQINTPGTNNIDANATIFEIAVSPKNSNVLFATTDKGFYKSIDGGINWVRKNTGIPYYDTRGLAINPLNPDIIYITVISPQSPWLGGVYKSIDGGETWSVKNKGLLNRNDGSGRLTSNYPDIVINPHNPNIIYTGDSAYGPYGPQKSIDGGENWVGLISYKDRKWQNIDLRPYGNVSVSTLCISYSNPDTIYFTTSMCAWKSTNAGNSWNAVHTIEVEPNYWKTTGIDNTCLLSISIDPQNPNNVYFGYADISLMKSFDGGISFKKSSKGMMYNLDIYAILVDQDEPNIIYAGDYYSGEYQFNSVLVKSSDYGDSWTVIGNPSNGLPLSGAIYSITLDPKSPVESRTIYVAKSGHGVYKTVNGGKHWSQINEGLPDNLNVRSLSMDPSNPNVLYLGIISRGQSGALDYGGVYKTINGGRNWFHVDNYTIPNVYDIKIDPQNPSTIYVAACRHWDSINSKFFQGGIFKSVDGGKNWKRILDAKWINCIAINPKNPNVIYAGGMDKNYHDEYVDFEKSGLFKSVDGGRNWKVLNEGLPTTNINTIAISHADPKIIYIGTDGNGGFKGFDASALEFSYDLLKGWNLFSVPIQPFKSHIYDALESIRGYYECVWSYDKGIWNYYNDNAPIFSDLYAIEPGKGYWISMSKNSSLIISGMPPNNSIINLDSGWNLVGCINTVEESLEESFSFPNGKISAIFLFDSKEQKFIDIFSNDYNTVLLKPGEGYWIYVQ